MHQHFKHILLLYSIYASMSISKINHTIIDSISQRFPLDGFAGLSSQLGALQKHEPDKQILHKPFKTILFNFTCKLCLVPYLFSQNSQGNCFSDAEGRSGLVGLPFLLLSAASTSTTLEWTENTGYSELKFIKYINHIYTSHKQHCPCNFNEKYTM